MNFTEWLDHLGLRHVYLPYALEPPQKQDDYLTPKQVAEMLKASRDTVLAWIRGGELKASNLNKKGKRPRWAVTRTELSEFLKKRQPEAKQQQTKRHRDLDDVTEYF